MTKETARRLFESIKQTVDEGAIPCAHVLVGQKDTILLDEFTGYAQLYPEKEALRPGTLFDVASLSKITGVWPGILLLLQSGELTLDTKLCDAIDYPVHEALKNVTIFNLLTHTAGLIPFISTEPFGKTREERIRGCFMTPPETEPNKQVVYSDLSFIFLGEILAQRRGKPLEACAADIWNRFGMTHTTYNPPKGAFCAATEFRPGADVPVRGSVHDERSEELSGVAGHAGVFSTAENLGKFLRACDPNDPDPIFDPDWLRRCYTNRTHAFDSDRGLAWVVYHEKEGGGIVGHTGFTGTSFWLDTETGVYIVILSNRVHPTRNNDAMYGVRKRAFEIAFEIPYV